MLWPSNTKPESFYLNHWAKSMKLELRDFFFFYQANCSKDAALRDNMESNDCSCGF